MNKTEAYNYMWSILNELGQLDDNHYFMVEDYNLTDLAEETCIVLDLYEGDDCPEELFELAYEAQHDVLTKIDNK